MKTLSSASVACCAALLITVPLMGMAATKNLVLTDAEPQYAGKLCWAAADVLAVNQFYPTCPASTNTTTTPTSYFPTSQALDASWHKWMKSGTQSVGYYLSKVCGLQIGNCSDWGYPPLNGLSYKWGSEFPNPQHPDPMGLDWATMKQEIDGGRPVLFIWDYPPNGISPTSPVGKHELVVTGYSDDSGIQQLQIWDPWPVPMVPPNNVPPSTAPACGPANYVPVTDNHSQSIYFSTYRNPVNDMGVAAVHDNDQWGLAKHPPSVPQAPVLTVDGGAPPPPPPPPPPAPPLHNRPQPPSGAMPQLSFAKALSDALPQSRQVNLQVSGGAPRSLGVPFPIVGLGFVQLLRASAEPTRLLADVTSAILFPVESQGKVVDAFLLLYIEGRWQRGGYANVAITRRLVDVRATYAARQHLPLDSFYMVSVPGEVAFFAAHGMGKKAILVPASTDPAIDARAGVAVLADKQLRKLTQVIQDDLRRYPEPSPDAVRPGR